MAVSISTTSDLDPIFAFRTHSHALTCLYVSTSFETTSVSLVVDIASQPAVTIVHHSMSPNKGKKLSVALPSSVY